jgi:hypothetical protein
MYGHLLLVGVKHGWKGRWWRSRVDLHIGVTTQLHTCYRVHSIYPARGADGWDGGAGGTVHALESAHTQTDNWVVGPKTPGNYMIIY